MISHKVIRKSDPNAEVWENELGECHREDGPAWISNAGWYWYQHSKLHRTDGPARILKKLDRQDWVVNGNDISKEVRQWLNETGYNWPLDKEQEAEFKLRFL